MQNSNGDGWSAREDKSLNRCAVICYLEVQIANSDTRDGNNSNRIVISRRRCNHLERKELVDVWVVLTQQIRIRTRNEFNARLVVLRLQNAGNGDSWHICL